MRSTGAGTPRRRVLALLLVAALPACHRSTPRDSVASKIANELTVTAEVRRVFDSRTVELVDRAGLVVALPRPIRVVVGRRYVITGTLNGCNPADLRRRTRLSHDEVDRLITQRRCLVARSIRRTD